MLIAGDLAFLGEGGKFHAVNAASSGTTSDGAIAPKRPPDLLSFTVQSNFRGDSASDSEEPPGTSSAGLESICRYEARGNNRIDGIWVDDEIKTGGRMRHRLHLRGRRARSGPTLKRRTVGYQIRWGPITFRNSRDVMIFVFFQNFGKWRTFPVTR